MLKLTNHTPLDARLASYTNPQGAAFAVVILKGTFSILSGRGVIAFSSDQIPIIDADQYRGEANTSSIKCESDLSPYKAATDIIVCGDAIAEGGQPSRRLDASVAINDTVHTVRVFGDRYWEKKNLSWWASEPQIFERMPLIFERAFGGFHASDPNMPPSDMFAKNPVGMGFLGPKASVQEGMPMPNLEYPGQLISSPEDKPDPAAFGTLCRAWEPRISLAGTYDEQWETERMPLLPLNFDERYYNGGNITHPILNGNETIVLTNMHESGPIRFNLPSLELSVALKIRGTETVYRPNLDTLYIEPNTQRISLTWRATVDCRREFLNIHEVVISRRK